MGYDSGGLVLRGRGDELDQAELDQAELGDVPLLTVTLNAQETELVRCWARARAFAMIECTDPSMLLNKVAAGIAAVVLRWDESGELLRAIRRVWDVPVFCVGTSPSCAVEALRAGAVDYLARPVDPLELWARLDARLGGRARALPSLRRLLWLDSLACSILGSGVRVKLRPAEYAVLAELASQPKSLFSATELVRLCLGTVGDGGSVRNHVYEIRERFRQSGLPNPIVTAPRRGYRLSDEVLFSFLPETNRTTQ